jgi:hypothetical protein
LRFPLPKHVLFQLQLFLLIPQAVNRHGLLRRKDHYVRGGRETQLDAAGVSLEAKV